MSKSTPLTQLPQHLTKAQNGPAGTQDLPDDEDVAIQEVLAEINAAHSPQQQHAAPQPPPPVPPVKSGMMPSSFTPPPPSIAMDHRYQEAPYYPAPPQQAHYPPPPPLAATRPPTMIETMLNQLWSMFKNEFTLFAVIALAAAFVNTGHVEGFIQQYLSFINFTYSQLLLKGVLTAVVVMLVRATLLR